MSSLTSDVISIIASYLQPGSVGRMAPVCKCWNEGHDLLWEAQAPFIDTVFWRSVGVEVDDVLPPLLVDVLRAKRKMGPHVESPSGDSRRSNVMRIVFPKGLTINRLLAIAKDNNVPFNFIWGEIKQELRDNPIPETYQALVTNAVLKHSRDRSYKDQKLLAEAIGCVVLPALEALALLIATHIDTRRSGAAKQISRGTYFRDPHMFGPGQIIVGGFDRKGIIIDVDKHLDYHSIGVGALWKF